MKLEMLLGKIEIKVKKIVLALLLGGIFSNLIGTFVYGAPKTPDILQGPGVVFGSFLLYLSYLTSQIAWGALILKLLRRKMVIWEAFFWGSAYFSLLLGTLGFFRTVGPESYHFWNGMILLGLGFGLMILKNLEESDKLEIHFSRIAPAVFCFALVFLAASIPHPFWDSLWYHLTAARYWFEEGRVHLPENFPIALKTGLWDYNFLLGQILLGGPEGGGLIAAHVFGQWATAGCAFFSFLLLLSIARPNAFSIWALMLGLIGTELYSVVYFAKNDWAAVFFGLSFLYFFLERESSWLIGLAAGVCFATKYSSVFFLMPFLAQSLWENRRSIGGDSKLILGFVLASLPLLLRNVFLAGNPFFPALSSIFETELLGPSWKNISYFEGTNFSLMGIKEKLLLLVFDSPAVLGLLFLPLAHKSLKKMELKVLYGCLLGGSLFFFFSGPKAEWRLAGASLVLLGCYGSKSLEVLFSRWRGVFPSLVILTFFFTPTNRDALKELVKAQDPALQVRSWVGGAAMSWVRMHAKVNEKTITLNEQRIYYLFPQRPTRAFDDPNLDTELSKAASPEEAVAIFKNAGIRYLVLSAEFLDRYYQKKICDWIFDVSVKKPEAVVFRGDLSRVLDLNRI